MSGDYSIKALVEAYRMFPVTHNEEADLLIASVRLHLADRILEQIQASQFPRMELCTALGAAYWLGQRDGLESRRAG